MFAYIYKTTNLLNNRFYIGKHHGDFNKNYLGSGEILSQAIKKYGSNNFATILIAQAINEKTLDILEKYYIAYYKEQFPNLIYNIAKGGEGGDTYTNHPNKKKIKEKHRIAALNHKIDCECMCCKTRRKEYSGKNHPMFGKHHTVESNNQNRLKHLGKFDHKQDCICSFCKSKRGEMKGVLKTEEHKKRIKEGVKRNWVLRHNKVTLQ